MQLGNWALIGNPSLWALIPLLIFIVVALSGKNQFIGLILGLVVGFFLTGQNFASLGKSFAGALGSSSMVIALLIMFGNGLGALMTEARITHTMVYWIVKSIGINTQVKGKIALCVASVLVCGLLGTLAGGNAIIAPIMIPILASLGVTPVVVAALFKVSGEIGLILGPLTGVTLMTMQVTGLSYGKLMLFAVIPFSIFWFAGTWIGANRAQKRTQGKESYEVDVSVQNLNSVALSPVEKRNTIIFLIAFVGLIVYGALTKQSLNYAIVVMLLLSSIIAVLSRIEIGRAVRLFSDGAGKQSFTLVLLLLFTVMLDMINAGGGFTALGNVLGKLAVGGGAAMVAIVAAVVGGFGIESAAVVEIQIIAKMFGSVAASVGLPMEVFAVSILAATRLTSSVYPTSNFMGQMITARSENTKEALQANWIGAGFAWIFIILYAVIRTLFI